jgi:hypothetical protein
MTCAEHNSYSDFWLLALDPVFLLSHLFPTWYMEEGPTSRWCWSWCEWRDRRLNYRLTLMHKPLLPHSVLLWQSTQGWVILKDRNLFHIVLEVEEPNIEVSLGLASTFKMAPPCCTLWEGGQCVLSWRARVPSWESFS